MVFNDRIDAGRRLAAALVSYRDEHPIVLALPRGGVPVAAIVAARLAAPLDLLLVRKLGAPLQPELAMGAVVDGSAPMVVRNEDIISAFGVSEAEFDAVRRTELKEIERRRTLYLGGRRPPDLKDRVVIVVDDGIATGATVRAGLKAIRGQGPRRLVLAVPVAPSDTLEALRPEVDEIVCLETHRAFGSIGAYYRDFRQLDDAEVIELLEAAADARREPKAR